MMLLSDLKEAAYNSAQVLASEAEEIAAQVALRNSESGSGPCAETNLRFKPLSTSGIPDRFALAFSGGGIRSACVALGILQAVSEAEMLSQVHYISAISGGGYMLGWLTAWTARLRSLTGVEKRLAFNTNDGLPPTVATPPASERHIEPFPLHYLRRYTSYLAPRSGLLSGDTLAMISVYLRNVLLNQTMLACLALSLMLCLQLPAFLNRTHRLGGIFLTHGTFLIVAVLFLAAFAIGIFFTAQSLYRLSGSKQPVSGSKEGEWYYAAPLTIVCGVVSCASLWVMTPYWYIHLTTLGHTVFAFLLLAVLGVSITCYYNRNSSSSSVERKAWFKALMYLLGWFAVVLVGFLFHLSVQHWLVQSAQIVLPRSYAVLGLPAFLIVLSLESYLWVGIVGLSLPDSKREWLARAAGWFLAIGLIIALIFAIGFYGPVAMHLLFTGLRTPGWKKKLVSLIIPGGWLFTVVSGLIGGYSSKSGDGASGSKPSSSGALDLVIAVAPPVFLLGVLLLASWASNALVRKTVLRCSNAAPCATQYLPWADWLPSPGERKNPAWVSPPQQNYPSVRKDESRSSSPYIEAMKAAFTDLENFVVCHPVARYGLLFAVLAFIAGLLAVRLDVNEFSLHLFYRNRLVRAFLGASRRPDDPEYPRMPSPFTGFAYRDDIYLANLIASKGFQGPYPIWGTCLNLTAGEELAWQQRKGASFIYSPLFCGWDFVDAGSTPDKTEKPNCDLDSGRQARQQDTLSKFGYRSTLPNGDEPSAAGYIPGYSGKGGAPLIGTAMAASGAAVSPNWGYHSKPAIAALLALFNLRLGWWTGNPRHPQTWKKYAPSIWYLGAELAGQATDRGKYVYLSDGGHFENLGLYELVRRRVRFIICSDADADPEFSFGDLGNAIDHCRRDFGVEIKIGAQRSIAAAKLEGFKDAHYAIGEIFYPGDTVATGTLLYIKSSLTSDEPSDVLGMKAQDPKFPHDTTLNQFFNETLFESYRALGQHMMQNLIEKSNVTQITSVPLRNSPLPNGSPDERTVGGERTRKFFDWLVQERKTSTSTTAAKSAAT
jgi:hypothetical protein